MFEMERCPLRGVFGCSQVESQLWVLCSLHTCMDCWSHTFPSIPEKDPRSRSPASGLIYHSASHDTCKLSCVRSGYSPYVATRNSRPGTFLYTVGR